MEGDVVEGKRVMDDDPFELAPIIEVVTKGNKGKNQQFQEVEYATPGECGEPKCIRPRMIVFSKAEETNREGFPKSP